MLLALTNDAPNLGPILRPLFSDSVQITAVVAEWRSFAAILTHLITTVGHGLPLTGVAPDGEQLVGGNYQRKCIDLAALANWVQKLCLVTTNVDLLSLHGLIILESDFAAIMHKVVRISQLIKLLTEVAIDPEG